MKTWIDRYAAEGGGGKAHGREATVDHRHTKVKAGYDYAHSLVDDHSRLVSSEILPDLAYRRSSALRELGLTHGIKGIFFKPHCPWQNGKVERLNRTLATGYT